MSDRLYILVDETLKAGQKMSQAGHAIAQFMLEERGKWENHTLIIKKAPRFIIEEAIKNGAIGYTDTYYNYPRAAAFTSHPKLAFILNPALAEEIEQLPLAS